MSKGRVCGGCPRPAFHNFKLHEVNNEHCNGLERKEHGDFRY